MGLALMWRTENVDENYTTGYRLVKTAAECDHGPAQKVLALLHLNGSYLNIQAIGDHDREEGIFWLQKAVSNGELEAMNQMNGMMMRGERFPIDKDTTSEGLRTMYTLQSALDAAKSDSKEA